MFYIFQRSFVSFVFVPVHVSSLLACMCDPASPASSRHAAAELVTFLAREHALTLRPVLFRLPQRISVKQAITVSYKHYRKEALYATFYRRFNSILSSFV